MIQLHLADFLQAANSQAPLSVSIQNPPAGFPWQALIGGIIGAAIGSFVSYLFNRNLQAARDTREDLLKTKDYKALLVLLIAELVYIHERCAQYVVQATGLINGTPDGGISKSTIYLQYGPSLLERIQVLGADWRVAIAGYCVYEIAGQVQRQLDRIPADFVLNDPSKRLVAAAYFSGIPAFVSGEVYEQKLLGSIHCVLETAETILPHEFIVAQRKQLEVDKRKHDAVRPPKPAA